MKKILPVIISLLLAVGVFAYSYIGIDRIGPTINVNGTPILACDVDMDDLLDYASASDDDLKTLFIEENDLLDILSSNKLLCNDECQVVNIIL